MPKVTVIMPALNVVKYIRPCIESVIAQTIKDLEILVIDAGSDDGTLEILQQYALRDERIQIIHSDKKSYGYQVNLGISLATGDYIGIVETDDIICEDAYEVLYETAMRTDAEYVKGVFEKFIDLPNGIKWSAPMGTPLKNEEMLGKVVVPRHMPELFLRDFYLWTGIYKKDFIRDIKLNESSGAAYQDVGFLFQVISMAKRAVYLNKKVYMYRQDNGNCSSFNRKGFQYLVGEYEYVGQLLYGQGEEWKCAFYQRMLDQTIARFKNMAISGQFWEETKADINILRERLRYAYQHSYINEEWLGERRWNELELLLKGDEQVYSYCKTDFEPKARVLQNLFNIIGERQIVIFGCGRYGKFFHALMESRSPGQVVGFCDNNSLLWNTEVQGCFAFAPEDAVRRFPEAVYVIAILKNAEMVKEQLINYNVTNKNIIIYKETPDMLLLRIKNTD